METATIYQKAHAVLRELLFQGGCSPDYDDCGESISELASQILDLIRDDGLPGVTSHFEA